MQKIAEDRKDPEGPQDPQDAADADDADDETEVSVVSCAMSSTSLIVACMLLMPPSRSSPARHRRGPAPGHSLPLERWAPRRPC
eukprot:scaffold309_cov235-Pinguiococcus_pyrenoidosus.AAC.25